MNVFFIILEIPTNIDFSTQTPLQDMYSIIWGDPILYKQLPPRLLLEQY